MNTNVVKVTPQQFERLERLRSDRRLVSIEELLEEIISLADSVYAGAREGYTDVVLRAAPTNNKIEYRKEKTIVRNYLRK